MSATDVKPGNPLEADDSPSAVLRLLEEDRGTVYSEEEYGKLRTAVIEELAHGPVCRGSTLLTFGVIGVLLLLVTLVGVFILVQGVVADFTLAMVGGASIAAWGYVVWGYRKGFRNHALRTLEERLVELEELRRQSLITTDEYDRIYAAVHMGRAEIARHRQP
ncbi:MAG: hypothetical protein JXQ71_02565 [Verrucomicrobia bacterium]|nr:hypothetical protein [Verrucomicrobiota bacterium]